MKKMQGGNKGVEGDIEKSNRETRERIDEDKRLKSRQT